MGEIKKIHCIGIGGIGLSNLAFFYLKKGCKISGSDLAKSEIIKQLKKAGAKIFIKHKANNLSKADLVIYSAAISKNNPELQQAQKLGIKCQTYAQALGELAKNYFLIAVAGTHGKTTTCSMISEILIKAGLDPSFIIGKKNGWRVGKSKYLIIEADEYKDSFLNYYPDIAVITNIEPDHLDYFKNFKNIKRSFAKFAKNSKKIIEYKKHNIKLQVPGQHNRYNASLAFEAAEYLNIKNNIIRKALLGYKGSWRRFEEHNFCKAKIIHDYAHHPTEIKATIQAAREKYKNKRIIAIFQPHQHQRLNLLFADFAKSFAKADHVIITSVYSVSGREEKIIKTGRDLANAIKNSKYLKLNKISEFIKNNADSQSIFLLMGAGDIYYLFNK